MGARQLGILEIFFGPAWTPEERAHWAEFLGREQFGFYMYGPKADANLRKNWREPWSEAYLSDLRTTARAFQNQGVQFAVALSPFAVEFPVLAKTKDLLRQKCKELKDVGADFLGLFFDDMPCTPGLAEMQLELLEVIRAFTQTPIVFCPSYYSTDPILDKVFGPRPPNYLETLASKLAHDTEILWTGPKVISPEISATHLQETARTLKRNPFVCDNFFANDGPKNCKFLKLKSATGRSTQALAQASKWSLNLMNQAHLSQILAHATKHVLINGTDPDVAFEQALGAKAPGVLGELLLRDHKRFCEHGLDQIEQTLKDQLRIEYASLKEPAAREVVRWLSGEYIVGDECLTD